jgi:tyrosine-protein kinase
VAGEGKSTVVANLAVTLARTGRRLVVVDLDLRRPRMGEFFGVSGRPGVMEAVLGSVDLDDAVVPVAIGSGEWNGHAPRAGAGGTGQGAVFELLSAGRLAIPNPGALAGTRALRDLLTALEDRAELVLIDSPPLVPVGDALALSTTVGGLVLVANLNMARRPTLVEVRRILDSCPATKLGFVLTGAKADRSVVAGGYVRAAEKERVS